MKKRGILNAPLCSGMARLGHGDVVVVADCGLPIPPDAPVVDLALILGTPRFTDVLDALLDELVIESSVAAEECRSGQAGAWIRDRLSDVDYVPHSEFKRLSDNAKLIVRTGEATPYANVALRCGVPF